MRIRSNIGRLFARVFTLCILIVAGLSRASAQPTASLALETTNSYGVDIYHDLAIGVPRENFQDMDDNGQVDILYGNYTGISATNAQYFMQGVNWLGDSMEKNDYFGYHLTSGDFNGDNRPDLVVGVPLEDLDGLEYAGLIHVLYGEDWGLSGIGSQTLDQGHADGVREEDDWFGYALAAGDFNCDYHDDLAIGAPYEDLDTATNAGAVSVLNGSPSGLFNDTDFQFWHQGSDGIANTPESDDQFGYALAAGDFNGDHCADLAIGVPYEDYNQEPFIKDAGVVHVLYGSPSGLSGEDSDYWLQEGPDIQGEPDDYDQFGFSLVAGYFNLDDYADLAIGIPGETVNGHFEAGAVSVLHGTSSGLTALYNHFWHQDVGAVYDIAEDDDHFGRTLASGDFNMDGFEDLAVGVSSENLDSITEAGAVHVFFGTNIGLDPLNNQFLWDSSSTHYTRFGSSLASGLFNGDGYWDLAIGAPGKDVDSVDRAGEVTILYGYSSGLVDIPFRWNQDDMVGLESAEDNDRFGQSLATLKVNHYHLSLPLVMRSGGQ